jgi:L-lactate dehydrogenase complex protein LldG
MTISRDTILTKLRGARRPFPTAPPRPVSYLPVTRVDDTSPDALLERFQEEMALLNGEVCVVDGEDAARQMVLDLLASHGTERVASWHFKHIPVKKLYTAIREAGYTIDYPAILLDDPAARERAVIRLETAAVGLTGADAVAASTATLIFSSAAGKGRIPTILPPVHIAVVRLTQFVPRVEDWLAKERAAGNPTLRGAANICFTTGPSRTADIEKKLVLGVHGPKRVQVVVIR